MKFFAFLCIGTVALGLYIGATEIDTKVPIRVALNLGVLHYKAGEWDEAEYWLTKCKNRQPQMPKHIRPEGMCQDKARTYLGMMDQDTKERELMKEWMDRKVSR